MAAPRQPIHTQIDEFSRNMRPTFERLSRDIRKRIKAGQPVDDAVRIAVGNEGLGGIVTDNILDSTVSLVEGVLKGTLDGDPAFRRFWLNNLWPGDDLTLSKRINDLSRMTDIKSSIKESLKAAKSWNGVASNLSKQNLQTADLPSHITRLQKSARRVITGDPAALKQYKRDLKRSIKAVEKLQKAGAPTGRLKKAYQNVINVSRGTSEKALDKAIDRLVKAKARFNSERIARTEMAKAYGQGTYQGAIDDPDVVGIRYELSSRHAFTDICDLHTGADMFGLGKGVYPLNNLPARYPFHPHCTCVMSYIFEGEIKPQVSKGGIDFLGKLSRDKQQAIMGVKGARVFRSQRSKWKTVVRGFGGHRDINTLRERKGIKVA